MYEHRLQLATSPECPPFFLQAKYIKAASTTTKVWNVYANDKDSDAITKELKKALNQPSLRQYYSWKEYNSLQIGQQITITRLQNQFLTEFRSLLIHGFKPTDTGESIMWDDNRPICQQIDDNNIPTGTWIFTDTLTDQDEDEEYIDDRFYNDINLTTCTVTDFIQQAFLSGDNTPVFSHVYSPILGTREVLVTRQHMPEALDLIKIIKTDLCRIMNLNAITKAINKYNDILTTTTTIDPWQPLEIQQDIAIDTTYPHHENQIHKRHKNTYHSTQPKRRTPTSYSNATKAFQQEIHNQDHTSTATNTTTSTMSELSASVPDNSANLVGHTTHTSDTFTNIQHQLENLKASIDSIDKRVTDTKNNTTKELEILDNKFNHRLENQQQEQQLAMQTLGESLIKQMQSEQSTTNLFLKTMLEQRENALEEKLQTHLQIILTSISPSTTSPSRKKQTLDSNIHDTNIENQSQLTIDTPFNPYRKTYDPNNTENFSTTNNIRRRSVNTLPTTDK
jgi:hypothetical protein